MIKTGHIKSESGRNILLTDITPSKELVDFEKSKRKSYERVDLITFVATFL